MPGLMVNIDNSFFFGWHPHDEMTVEGLHAFVDQYADTQVTDLQFCLNAQRSSVDCKSRQTVWDGYDPDAGNGQPFLAGVPDQDLWEGGPNARQHMRKWVHGCWLLHSRGIDPYAEWVARSRSRGIRGWLSMRMNDVHFVHQPEHCIHDRFWQDHREFRRDPDSAYNGHCLDYGREEVRDYQMAYAREMIAGYDMDGFELDWMRNPHYFRPGRETEDAPLLTEFVREVRGSLDERAAELGHPVLLGVRVPAHPDTALMLGMDVAAWARLGLVDTVVVSSFLHHEFDVPMEIWKSMLAGTGARLAGGMMSALRSCGGASAHNLETARGAAVGLLDRGADCISLFNFFDYRPYGVTGDAYRGSETAETYRRTLRQLGSLAAMLPLSRRHVLTPCDCCAPGQKTADPLPLAVPAGKGVEARLHAGPPPTRGQRAQVRLEIEGASPDQAEGWNVSVNRVLCRAARRIAAPPGWTLPTLACDIPDGALHPGYSLVRVANDSDASGGISWLEIATSDADGKFPRGVDEASMFPK